MQLEGELEVTKVAVRDKDAANGALRQEMGQLRQQVGGGGLMMWRRVTCVV